MLTDAPSRINWTLSEFGEGAHQHRCHTLPLRELIVGRTDEADLSIPCGSVSKRHARITFECDEMVVKDLGSTNGTYLNGERISCSSVKVGDLLQFANALYRVDRARAAGFGGTVEEGILPWAQTLLLFDQLLSQRAVIPHFQPIVALEDQASLGFELLARSEVEGLTSPATMFGAAERLGQNATLSEIMREEGLRIAMSSAQADSEFYLNTHPCEVINDRLCDSLRSLRDQYPQACIVIEIHEAAVADTGAIRSFRQQLDALDMKLA